MTITAIITLILIIIIFMMAMKIVHYKSEYHHIANTAYHMKLFILDRGLDDHWQEYIKKIDAEENDIENGDDQ